jgi:hypothetical protein
MAEKSCFLKVVLLSFCILFLLSSLLFSQPLSEVEYYRWKAEYVDSLRAARWDPSAPLRREMMMATSNRYIRGVMDEASGEIEEGADQSGSGGPYLKLTFGYDHPPSTSWVMYKIDDFAAEKTNEGALIRTVSRSYTIPGTRPEDGDVLVCEWDDIRGVKIKQTIQAVRLGAIAGENEQIKFKTYITSADGGCHRVGSMLFFDTMLNMNDAAPISTTEGYTGRASIFYAPSIPMLWRAYEVGFPPGPRDLVGLGILTVYEAVMPDVFWYGQWGSGVGRGWDDSEWAAITGGTFTDSATMVKWYQRMVCPGDTLTFCTYYGIGNLLSSSVYSSHLPVRIEANCDSLYPNPHTSSALIVNAGTSDAINMTATMITPPGMIVTSTNPIDIGTLVGYGATTSASWDVMLDHSVYGTTQRYSIMIVYEDATRPGDLDTIYNEFLETIPPGPFSIAVSADDTTMCLGDSTMIHLSINEGGSPFYNVHWFPPEIFSNPFARESWVKPTGNMTVYAIVSDSLDCEHIDSVRFIMIDPPTPPVLITPANGAISIPVGDLRLIWNHSDGTGPITYSVRANGNILATGLSDTFFVYNVVCSDTIEWVVTASNDCGDTPSLPSVFSTIPCGNPLASVVHPYEGTYSSCSDQVITIAFTDDYL